MEKEYLTKEHLIGFDNYKVSFNFIVNMYILNEINNALYRCSTVEILLQLKLAIIKQV